MGSHEYTRNSVKIEGPGLTFPCNNRTDLRMEGVTYWAPFLSYPCAQLIKHYAMKTYEGVEV
jgi:hypothetical protein